MRLEFVYNKKIKILPVRARGSDKMMSISLSLFLSLSPVAFHFIFSEIDLQPHAAFLHIRIT